MSSLQVGEFQYSYFLVWDTCSYYVRNVDCSAEFDDELDELCEQICWDLFEEEFQITEPHGISNSVPCS